MALTRFRCRFGCAAAGTLAALVMTAAPANAQLSDNQCAAVAMSQPFAPWWDFADYTLAPGGDMEAGGARWALSGGAGIVNGNEPFYVGDRKDRASLRLPSASSATSTAMCVGIEYPTLRFFATREAGSLNSSLLVEALFADAEGRTEAVPIASVQSAGAWAPTAPLPTVVNALALLEPISVSFGFTPQDGSQWSIDDVYVDPYRTV